MSRPSSSPLSARSPPLPLLPPPPSRTPSPAPQHHDRPSDLELISAASQADDTAAAMAAIDDFEKKALEKSAALETAASNEPGTAASA